MPEDQQRHRAAANPGEWVLLCYRVPREPSTPRIAIWRRLKRLGVAQISDGLVALPADARTQEQLEWVADEAIDAGGAGAIWLARPSTLSQERELAQSVADARAAEYRAVIEAAHEAAAVETGTGTGAVMRRLRAELRRIGRRDFFPPAERDHAHAAVRALADENTSPGGAAARAGRYEKEQP